MRINIRGTIENKTVANIAIGNMFIHGSDLYIRTEVNLVFNISEGRYGGELRNDTPVIPVKEVDVTY